jgi:hypothetical protein
MQFTWGFVAAAIAIMAVLSSPSSLPAPAPVAAISLEIGVGESVTERQTAAVPDAPVALDLVLDLDASGTFSNDIAAIHDQIDELGAALRAETPDTRMAVTSFSDFPFYPWGDDADAIEGPSVDFAYQRNQNLTVDVDAVKAAVGSLPVADGRDVPESQLETLVQAVTGAGLDINGNGVDEPGDIPSGLGIDFRPNATKVIVVATDAPMHVRDDSVCQLASPPCPFGYPGPTMDRAIAVLQAAGVHIIGIKIADAGNQLDQLAAATGGVAVESLSGAEIVNDIIESLPQIAHNVTVTPVGCEPLLVTVDPSEFRSVLAGSEVTFDVTVTVPVGTPAGDYSCVLEIRMDGALAESRPLDVTVDAPPVDNPPDCRDALADPSMLWPPDHRMVPIDIDGVTDEEGPVTMLIDGITSNEPQSGGDPLDRSPDWEGVGTSQASVRAERNGDGDGRVYTISFSAEDSAGQACSGQVTVTVPLDDGNPYPLDVPR